MRIYAWVEGKDTITIGRCFLFSFEFLFHSIYLSIYIYKYNVKKQELYSFRIIRCVHDQ